MQRVVQTPGAQKPSEIRRRLSFEDDAFHDMHLMHSLQKIGFEDPITPCLKSPCPIDSTEHARGRCSPLTPARDQNIHAFVTSCDSWSEA